MRFFVNSRIGIYGIAANPPTLGHTYVINTVLDKKLVDEIWVIPTYINFLGKQMAPYNIRFDMCKRAFSDIDGVKIKNIEYAIAELVPDYDGSTLSMLEELRKHKNGDFTLIIGQDNADNIFNWRCGNKLIREEKFIIIPRLSDSKFTDVTGVPMWYTYEPHILINDINQLDCSSSIVRDLLKSRNISFNEQLTSLITESTLEIITHNNLYDGS